MAGFIVEGGLLADDLWRVAAAARRIEALGYTSAMIPEINHDPFLVAAVAAEHTARVEIGTAVAVAFPRAPMVAAQLSWDLQRFSKGRFSLGLGTQVRKHNEDRFGVPWTPPVPRMREYILTVRAIWDSWQHGSKPAFSGQHYRYTFTTPFFRPGAIDHPKIPIAIAAVNPAMCRLAGELCDAARLHYFCTRRYLDEVVIPNLARGAAKTGRSLDDIELAGGGFIATGPDDETVARELEGVRRQVAFYGSTPAYRRVLDTHGWAEIGDRLSSLARAGKWLEMAAAVPDDVLHACTAVGRYDEIVPILRERFRGVHRLYFPLPDENPRDEARVRELVEELQGA